ICLRAPLGGGLRRRLPARLARRQKDGAAAVRGTAAAAIELFPLGVLLRIAAALVLIVVNELLARPDRPQRVDPDPPVLDDRLAVRVARVIDETRLVAVARAVDDGLSVDREEEGVVTPHPAFVVAPVRLLVRDALAGIFDDALPLADEAHGEGSGALDGRTAELERKSARPLRASAGGDGIDGGDRR